MASTPEPTPASPTPDLCASVEHEVQHEAVDGDSNTPSPKKPRRRKSRLLSGLDTANILPSPQSQGVVDNDDDDASASRTQGERRVKERPQREARLSNTRDQYDMKYHPLDEQIRPAYAAKRRSLTTQSPSTASSSTADDDDDADASDTESLPSSARVSDTEPSFHSRLPSSAMDLEISVPTQRCPDPKATRHSTREEARKHHDYSAKRHPQDYGIPGHQHKARKADRVAFQSTQAATQTGRKRKRDSHEMSGAPPAGEEESRPPRKKGGKKAGRGKRRAAMLSSGDVDDLVESTLRNIGDVGGAAGTPIVISDGNQPSEVDQVEEVDEEARNEQEQEDEDEDPNGDLATLLGTVESVADAVLSHMGPSSEDYGPDLAVHDAGHRQTASDNTNVDAQTTAMPETQNTTASSRTMVAGSEEESVDLDEEAPLSEFADQLAVTETRDTRSNDIPAANTALTATEEVTSDAPWDPTPPGSHPSQEASHVDRIDSPHEQNNPQYPSPATSLDVPAASQGLVGAMLGLFEGSTGFQTVNAPQ